jgi:hypothetical protein
MLEHINPVADSTALITASGVRWLKSAAEDSGAGGSGDGLRELDMGVNVAESESECER